MRLCRFRYEGKIGVAFYDEQQIVPLAQAAQAHTDAGHARIEIPAGDNLLPFLPPGGELHGAANQLSDWVTANAAGLPDSARLSHDQAELLVPIPRPNKLLLLAGNYAQHIEEGGGIAAERAETFPYVFMKPPTTTLTDPGKPVRVPAVSPAAIDWELELGVVMGRRAKRVSEADALNYVAGYTVVNDISDRKFRPNAQRKKRDRDAYFDWLHGKWHDSFCPCGPCIASADSIADPQSLHMKLSLNGKVMQDATTAQQIFPVAAVIEFISSFVTLEPGDIISTGTPAGVGNTTGTYLKPGDTLEASISSIGRLISPIAADEG